MSLEEHEIFDAAFQMPYESRKELTERLLETLEEKDQAAIEKAWMKEAEKRLADYRAGKIKGVPAEEVFESLKTRMAQ